MHKIYSYNVVVWTILIMSISLVFPVFANKISNATLLCKDNLVYKGAFKVPLGKSGTSKMNNSFAYGGGPLAYNPAKNTLFVGGHIREQLVAEISIPIPVKSSNIPALNRAVFVQGFRDITEGNMTKIGADGSVFGSVGDTGGAGIGLGGLLVFNNKLIGTVFHGYDMQGLSTRSHFIANPNWNNGTTIKFNGMYQVGKHPIPVPQAGFIDGYMALIPQEWQNAFGGPVISGQSALSGINRTSRGPAAFAFNPDMLGVESSGSEENPVTVTPLIYYDQLHRTIGDYGTNNTLYFTRSTQIKGVVFPTGTSSVLFFGRTGLGYDGSGISCYGSGTSNKSEARTNVQMDDWWVQNPTVTKYICGGNIINRRTPNVSECCYDPVSSAKGDHGFPYVYYVWAYDANELMKVKLGEKLPWEVIPYGVWTLDFPANQPAASILGVAYDSARQRIFVSQFNGEPNGERFPLIHIFEVKIDASSAK